MSRAFEQPPPDQAGPFSMDPASAEDAEQGLSYVMQARRASQVGDIETLRYLLDSKLISPCATDSDDCTLLHWAAINNRIEVAKLLIERGAEVNAIGGVLVSTPLHWSARHGHASMVSLLVTNGANLEIRDSEGFTPLHMQCISIRLDSCSCLFNRKWTVAKFVGQFKYESRIFLSAGQLSIKMDSKENVQSPSYEELVRQLEAKDTIIQEKDSQLNEKDAIIANLKAENEKLRSAANNPNASVVSRKRADSDNDDLVLAKRPRTDEEDNCHFVYTFEDVDQDDLYFGHGTTKSPKCREFFALYPQKRDDRPAYQTIRQHLNSTGIYVFRAFTNLTLKQAKDIEYLLILHVKEKEKFLPIEERTLTNLVNGTFSNEIGQLGIKERLKLAAETYEGMRKFVEAEKPSLFIGDQIKKYQPVMSQRMIVCANCHEYKPHKGRGYCNACHLASNRKKGVCKGEDCTTPKDSDGNVFLHAGGLCQICYYQEFNGATKRAGLVCSACKEQGHMKNNKACPKYFESHPADAPKRKAAAEIKCGACGQIGHMRTNKKCPLYVKKE